MSRRSAACLLLAYVVSVATQVATVLARVPLVAGEVDSLGIEQLVEYVFELWGAELDDEEIVEENFESVAALATLVQAKIS